MKIFALILSVLLLVGFSSGQDFGPVVKQVAPEIYPAAARAVRAMGRVGVSVNVDSAGKVVSAEAFSGHPLLRATSVLAARSWAFETVAGQQTDRSFVLFFDYNDGEERIVDEGDKERFSTIRHNFVSPFEIALFGDINIPRFLRLARKDGKIPKESCDLHDNELSIEVQSVDCSGKNELYDADVKYSDNEQYSEAEENEFPKANIFVGCKSNGIERVETRYCAKCRLARGDWISRAGN